MIICLIMLAIAIVKRIKEGLMNNTYILLLILLILLLIPWILHHAHMAILAHQRKKLVPRSFVSVESGIGTAFNQLPEQIQKHYPNIYIFGGVWLNETQAVLSFYPGGDRDEMRTHYWEKTTSGWVLIQKQGDWYYGEPNL
jgi:hypothetical protein